MRTFYLELGNPHAIWLSCVLLFGAAAMLAVTMLRISAKIAPLEFTLRLLVVTSLCFALFDPHLVREYLRARGILLVDVSDSIEPEIAERLLKKASAYQDGGKFIYDVLPFSGSPAPLVISASEAHSYSNLKTSWNKLDIGETDLETALRSPLIEPGTNLLLLSDGRETRGDMRQMLGQLHSAGTKIFPLVSMAEEGDTSAFRISHIHAPLVAPAKKSVDIRVSIKNTTAAEQIGRLKVRHDQKIVFDREVQIAASREEVFVTQSDPLQDGIREVVAILEPRIAALPPSSAQIFLSGEEREKVLLISSSSEEGRILEGLFSTQAYQVQHLVTSGKGLPQRPDFSKYSAVIFNNVPLAELPRDTPAEIEKFVSKGGGFIMIGGNKSFGLGGYKSTSIEDVLPVTLLPPRREQKRLNVAVEMVLDKSGSMKEDGKIEFTRSGAAEVIKTLKDEDYVGIVGFDEYPFHLVTMGKLSDIREKALSRLSQLYPAKSTRLLAAMEVAKRDLQAAQAGRKHMIILTDGKLPDPHNRPYYLELVKELRLTGITVSTFLIGDEYVPLLTEIAEAGGGAFYRTRHASSLPKLFLNDVKVNAGERTQKESSKIDVRTGDRLTSTELRSFPPVLGYVETRKKPDGLLELQTAGGQQDDPILASWNYKSGRATAFTSDASGRWSYHWVGWPKFYKFWTDVVDSVRPRAGERLEQVRFDLRFYVEKGSLFIDLSVYSTEPLGAASADLTMNSLVSRTPVKERHPLAPFLAALAMLLLCLEIARRELLLTGGRRVRRRHAIKWMHSGELIKQFLLSVYRR